jgi:hypothetical protein
VSRKLLRVAIADFFATSFLLQHPRNPAYGIPIETPASQETRQPSSCRVRIGRELTPETPSRKGKDRLGTLASGSTNRGRDARILESLLGKPPVDTQTCKLGRDAALAQTTPLLLGNVVRREPAVVEVPETPQPYDSLTRDFVIKTRTSEA